MSTFDTRGLLVVVEGLDRSGKSSQCQLLHDYLTKTAKSVKYVKFPDRSTPTGQMINSYLTSKTQQDDHSIHLLFSANRWEAVKGILESIENGTTVIVDRYSFSGAVYSAAKDNPDLSLDWAWYPEIGLPQPDLVYFLDISSADAAKRGGYGEERYETEKMQTRVRSLFTELFTRLSDISIQVIDAGGSMDDVASNIITTFDEVAATIDTSRPLKKLQSLSS